MNIFCCDFGFCGQCHGLPLRQRWGQGNTGCLLWGGIRLNPSLASKCKPLFPFAPVWLQLHQWLLFSWLAPDARHWDLKPSLIVSKKLSVCCFPSSAPQADMAKPEPQGIPKEAKSNPLPQPHVPSFSKLQPGPVRGFGVSGELFERKGPFSQKSQK